jgi:hypothetical protein
MTGNYHITSIPGNYQTEISYSLYMHITEECGRVLVAFISPRKPALPQLEI